VKSRQEVIQLKSPILLKLGTIFGFGEIMTETKRLEKYFIPLKLGGALAKIAN